MKNQILTIGIVAMTLFMACNQNKKNDRAEKVNTEKVESANDNIVNQSLTDKNGNELKMKFNNAKNIVTIEYEGEKAELAGKRAASGIWYANDQYELRGKGNNITLKKDEETIFEHQDNIIAIQSKNEKGDVLNMTFNNTQGTVKAYFNGGEEINMQQQKSASGFWYINENYDLSGKGNDITLKKEGKVIYGHRDKKVAIEAKNDSGDVLNMTFNNSQGTVKAYLNGGEQIDLQEKKAASGIWYANDHYELSGKGNHYELKKDGKIIFKN